MKTTFMFLLGTIIFLNADVIAQNKLDSIGNVGIGTLNPLSALQIGNPSVNNQRKITFPGTYNFEWLMLGQEGNGNAVVEFINHNSSSSAYGIKMGANFDKYGQGFFISTASSATSYTSLQYNTTPALFINTGNNVGIGTTSISGYRLAVAGNMIAEKIKVKVQSGWPDYVFTPSYNLPSLEQVETFIKAHQHLPEIPSSKEVEENGLDVGGNQAKLLQKIEELTLYLIEQDKMIKTQQQLLLAQEQRLKEVENRQAQKK